nr:immunoglobulin heavy chain junction region [Mus musculus]
CARSPLYGSTYVWYYFDYW